MSSQHMVEGCCQREVGNGLRFQRQSLAIRKRFGIVFHGKLSAGAHLRKVQRSNTQSALLLSDHMVSRRYRRVIRAPRIFCVIISIHLTTPTNFNIIAFADHVIDRSSCCHGPNELHMIVQNYSINELLVQWNGLWFVRLGSFALMTDDRFPNFKVRNTTNNQSDIYIAMSQSY